MSIQVRKYRDLTGLVEELAGSNEMLFIVPTRKKAHYLEQKLLAYRERPGIYTLPDFLLYCYRQKGGEKRLISPAQQILIGERIIEDNQSRLSFFPDIKKYPGLAGKIKDLFTYMVQFKKSWEELAERELQGDLKFLWEKYCCFLEKHNLLDPDWLAWNSGDLLRHKLGPWQKMGLDTLYYTTPREWEIIGKMEEWFSGAILYSDLPETLPPGRSLLTKLRAFNQNQMHFSPSEESYPVAVHHFFNPEEEVRAVARSVRSAIKAGISPQEIFVVLANFPEYQFLIREIFPQYNIPFDLARGFPLADSPPAVLLKTLLDLIETPYSRTLLTRFFSSSLVEIPGLDIRFLDNFARRFNFNDLQPLIEGELEVGSFISIEEGREIQEGFNRIGEFISKKLVPLGKTSEPVEFLDLISEILSPRVLLRRIIPEPGEVEETDLRKNAIALRQLEGVLQLTRELFDQGVLKASTPGYRIRRTLNRLIEEKEYYIPETAGGVQVTQMLNMRGWPAPRVYLLGLTQASFPPRPQSNFMLEGRDSAEIFRESRSFFLHLLARSGEVHITVPSFSRGQETQPSPLLKRLKRDKKELYPPEEEDKGSLNELLTWLASNLEEEKWRYYAHPRDVCLLNLEKERQSKAKGEYRGYLGPGIKLQMDPIAVTALEDYWRCPFFFFLKWVLGVEKREEVQEEEEPSLLGLQIHRILELFGQQGGFRILKQDFQGSCSLMKSLALQVLKNDQIDPERNPFVQAQYKAWLRGLEDQKEPPGVFYQFLQKEKERISEVQPFSFETDLSGTGDYPVLGPFRVKGRIDRKDQMGSEGLMVYDYKTGQVPATRDISEKRNLQLPLYIMALKNRPELEDKKILGTYYQLRPRNSPHLGPLIGDAPEGKRSGSINSLEDLGGAEEYKKILRKIYRGIQEGQFPTTSWNEEQAGCVNCPYKLICRGSIDQVEGGSGCEQ